MDLIIIVIVMIDFTKKDQYNLSLKEYIYAIYVTQNVARKQMHRQTSLTCF